jgi:RimJ/RimL family protein N-acetyltransferase
MMELLPIPETGDVAADFLADEFLQSVIGPTLSWYERVGFHPPWIGYIACENAALVGVCGFKTAPQDGRVEIAYGTKPGFEGQGVATQMARELIRIARDHDPQIKVFAQTLPEENASTSLLKKLGFQCLGSVEHPEDGTVWEWELLASGGRQPPDDSA